MKPHRLVLILLTLTLIALVGETQPPSSEVWRQQAEWEFRRKDANGDQKLSPDEMEGKLRDSLARWDANRDGLIDFPEYLGFFQWKLQEKAAKGALKAGLVSPKDYADQTWEAEFRRRDRNGDGLLNADEMEGKLRDSLPQWDANRDGLIDRGEFRLYYLGKIQDQVAKDAAKGGIGLPRWVEEEEDWDRRPVVYRAGKLPKELPAWFAELDRNQDGQVSLAEWLRAGNKISDYEPMDFNEDGLLTPEELLRFMKKTPTAIASAADGKPALTLSAPVLDDVEWKSPKDWKPEKPKKEKKEKKDKKDKKDKKK